MNNRLSLLMKKAIIINVILLILAMCVHTYNIYRTYETQAHIVRVMEEENVIKETAIRMLQNDGVDLYLGFSSAIFSMCNCLATLAVLFFYARSNSFYTGFLAAFFSVFSTYLGGMFLFYVFFSGKSERTVTEPAYQGSERYMNYIHERSVLV